jgi:virginiamycin A acetyltransferase
LKRLGTGLERLFISMQNTIRKKMNGSGLPPLVSRTQNIDYMAALSHSNLAPRKDAWPSGVVRNLYALKPLRRAIRQIFFSPSLRFHYLDTARAVFKKYHEVSIGEYSYGPIFTVGVCPPGTIIGRYVSIGRELMIRRQNHPIDHLCMHPFFYEQRFGYVAALDVSDDRENPLTIGHGVWIGDRVMIMPGCTSIGNGSVIAAGSVVTKNVEPYSIVAGVAAKSLRCRFDPGTIAAIEATQWWDKSVEEVIHWYFGLTENQTTEGVERA